MKRVDFIVIGVQKAATTTIYHHLKNHPEVELPPKKELHFFDNESYFPTDNYDLYHQHFHDTAKLWGEVTPIYIYWDNSIRRIWEYRKDIKLIVVLRDPIERAFSQWNMEFNRSTDSLYFDKAIRTETERSRESLPYQHRVYSYIDRGLYAKQIERLFQYFPKEQILVLEYSELDRFPLFALNKITAFLGISSFTSVSTERHHKTAYNYTLLKSDYEYLKDKFNYDVKSVKKLLSWENLKWMKKKIPYKVLFYRDFRRYQGGHQVMFHYFKFFMEHPDFEPFIAFSDESTWENNPWLEYKDRVVPYETYKYDILFIGGNDWQQIGNHVEEYKTVINLIQGFRHFDIDNPINVFLKRKALRIAASYEIAQALYQEKITDVTIIENGLSLYPIKSEKIFDIYIMGLKQKSFAKQIGSTLQKMGYNTLIQTDFLPQNDIYKNMAESKISILLPSLNKEGFYLPAIEAMYYSDIVIVGDAVGNRSFCKDGYNVLMPKIVNESTIVESVQKAFNILNDNKALNKIKYNAKQTVAHYSIDRQKYTFFKFLESIFDV